MKLENLSLSTMRHPSSRNQRRLIKKLKDEVRRDKDKEFKSLEEKEIIDELREQSQKAIKGTDD